MRLDSTNSNLGMSRLIHDDLRMVWLSRVGTRLRPHSNGIASSTESGAKRSGLASQSAAGASMPFATLVAGADSEIPNRQRTAAPPIGREGLIDQPVGRTATSDTVPATPNVQSGGTGTTTAPAQDAAPKIFHTPFGEYDEISINNRLVVDVVGNSPMEIFFMTHAPGEWVRNPGDRLEFEKIYGPEALVTVDRHGTVPRNTDPVWVTNPASGATTGRA